MNGPGFLMGGYAFYVWGAYVLTLMAMGGELFLLVRRWRALHTSVTSQHIPACPERAPRVEG